MTFKIAIAGASGFIGKALVSFFEGEGHEVIKLSRTPKEREFYWDPEKKEIDPKILENSDAVINFCGESIFGRWTAKKKERIRKSRTIPTDFLCETLLTLEKPPKLYIGASAVGYYGDRGDEVLTEESLAGEGELAAICKEWEAIPQKLMKKGIRVALARFGIVLGPDGGALKKMLSIFRWGLGGNFGSGQQYVSWIAIDDLVFAMQHLLVEAKLSGPINFVAPFPVTNQELTKTLSKLLNTPALCSMPTPALYLIFGSGAEVYLNSTRAFPKRLEQSGFAFTLPTLEDALKKYLRINS